MDSVIALPIVHATTAEHLRDLFVVTRTPLYVMWRLLISDGNTITVEEGRVLLLALMLAALTEVEEEEDPLPPPLLHHKQRPGRRVLH